MQAKAFRWMADEQGEWLCVNADGAHELLESLDPLKDYDVEIKRRAKKRSLDANAYYWVLAGKLAQKLEMSAEGIYQHHIRDMSNYETLCMLDEAVDAFDRRWCSSHLGRFTEKKESKIDGCTVVLAYYGSSDFSSAEMARLIDHCVTDCKMFGIETMPPEQLRALVEAWV